MRTVLLGLCIAGVMASCGPSSTASSTRPSSRPATSIVPTMYATPGPPHVDVVGSGAAQSPTGTWAFVVVRNGSKTDAAHSVTVSVTATSANGFPAVHASQVLNSIGPETSDAIAVGLDVPRGDVVDKISATASVGSTTDEIPPHIVISTPQMSADPIEPSANSTVTSPTSGSATIVVVCWDSHNGVLGGGESEDVRLLAGQASTVTTSLALRDTPDHCTGYANLA